MPTSGADEADEALMDWDHRTQTGARASGVEELLFAWQCATELMVPTPSGTQHAAPGYAEG